MKEKLIIRKGVCACGCGRKTKLNNKFIHGHNSKREGNPNWKGGRCVLATGYARVNVKSHPRMGNGKTVFEHILIAEKILGKFLPEKAVIHHVNEERADNRNENLVICENEQYHRLLHVRTRALKSCGHANWRKCKFCKKYDSTKNMRSYMNIHPECDRKYQVAMYHKRNGRISDHDNRAN